MKNLNANYQFLLIFFGILRTITSLSHKRCDRLIYLLGSFEVLEDAVDGASIHEEVILDTLHHHPKTTSFETVGHLSSPTTYHWFSE